MASAFVVGYSVGGMFPSYLQKDLGLPTGSVARDRPKIWGIMTIGIGPVGYVAGWGSTDELDAAFGWDRD
jgi:hypothetical protein